MRILTGAAMMVLLSSVSTNVDERNLSLWRLAYNCLIKKSIAKESDEKRGRAFGARGYRAATPGGHVQTALPDARGTLRTRSPLSENARPVKP
jgi:hypothetical protein